MSNGDGLLDRIYDAIAAGRRSLRVGNAKPATEGATTFFVSFLLTLDNDTHEVLRKVADGKQRSAPRLLKRYIKDGFRECFEDERVADKDDELKEAA